MKFKKMGVTNTNLETLDFSDVVEFNENLEEFVMLLLASEFLKN
jgi:hypothetical protein